MRWNVYFCAKEITLMSSDHILFQQWQQGDDDAYDKLFRNYYKKLCFAAIKTTENLADAEDIVQDLFVELFNAKNTIEVKTTIQQYLFGALYFKCAAYLKSNNKHKFNQSIDDVEIGDSSSIPAQILESIEFETLVFDAIDSLPEKCKQIFELSRFENLKNKEVAEKLNISIKTVENQMSIALKKLNSSLLPYMNVVVITVILEKLDWFKSPL